MVKFGEDDPIYQIIMSFISDLSNGMNSLSKPSRDHVDPTPVTFTLKSLRTFSNIPFLKDPDFVGRKNSLAQLETEFANPRSQRWASLYGLGGIG